jgi:hypothetical protein
VFAVHRGNPPQVHSGICHFKIWRLKRYFSIRQFCLCRDENRLKKGNPLGDGGIIKPHTFHLCFGFLFPEKRFSKFHPLFYGFFPYFGECSREQVFFICPQFCQIGGYGKIFVRAWIELEQVLTRCGFRFPRADRCARRWCGVIADLIFC